MTQKDLFEICLAHIATDVEIALHKAIREAEIDDAQQEYIKSLTLAVFKKNDEKYLNMLLNKPEEEPMTVLGAEIVRRGGLTIKFTTTHKVTEGDIFLLRPASVNPQWHYFKANGIAVTDNGLLKVDATETGYYVRYFDHDSGFDPRTIIGLPVTPIVDEETIKDVRKAALWC